MGLKVPENLRLRRGGHSCPRPLDARIAPSKHLTPPRPRRCHEIHPGARGWTPEHGSDSVRPARTGHPAWTANLRVHPDAEIVVYGRTIPVHATEIGDDERDAVWARIEAQWPGYRGYERESGRTVRLFRLRAVRPGLTASPRRGAGQASIPPGSAPGTLSG